jgi:hypothetical protein
MSDFRLPLPGELFRAAKTDMLDTELLSNDRHREGDEE